MESFDAVEIGRNAIFTTLMVGAPLLLVGLVIGLMVGVFQTITQIQDQAMTVVPKIIVTLLAFAIILPWLFRVLADYSTNLIENIPQVISGG